MALMVMGHMIITTTTTTTVEPRRVAAPGTRHGTAIAGTDTDGTAIAGTKAGTEGATINTVST